MASSEFERTDVTFDSWGLRCAAWLYRPQGADTEPLPCVVMAHGWTAVREQALDRFAERFATAGLSALVFDYRHFGASEGEPRQLLDVKRQLADWAAAIGYARSLSGIDPERVALWGSSFAGGHVLATAARDHRVAAVVAQVPFIDGLKNMRFMGPAKSVRLAGEGLRDALAMLRGLPPHMVASVGPPGSVAVMTSPDAEPGFNQIDPAQSTWRNEAAARVALTVGSYRPGTKVDRIKCPVLYCVADADAVTPPSLATAAAQRTPDSELVRYPIGHFDIYVGEWFERAVTDQTEFLQRVLLPRATAAENAPTATEPVAG
jgi:cephalosporin-C deacetylase-like acetyl esterase